MTERIIIGLIVAAVVFTIGHSLWRGWNGRNSGCSGCCSSCPLGKTCNTIASGNIAVSGENSAQSAGQTQEDKRQ